MTSVKVAAIAVVAVLIVAVVGYVAIDKLGDNDDAPSGNVIGTDVQKGDSYTLATSYSSQSVQTTGANNDSSITREVIDVDGTSVVVKTTEGGTTTTDTMQKDEYLDDICVINGEIEGQYLGTETLKTSTYGDVKCWIYSDTDIIGNTTTVTTYEWIGEGTNIIYKVLIEYSTLGTKEAFVTTLHDTNMIEGGSGEVIPEEPSVGTDIRTDLQVGDFIEFTERDDDDDDDLDRERATIVAISGDMVMLDDDGITMTKGQFLKFIMYDGNASVSSTETIDTIHGTIACNVYEDNDYFAFIQNLDDDDDDDDDNDDRFKVKIWASSDGKVIYRFQVIEGDGDSTTNDLSGTSLFSEAPAKPSAPADNRYGVDLVVGDHYEIADDDGDSTVYEIVAIDGNRLTVKETEYDGNRTEVEYERMSANEFLDDILITDSALNSSYSFEGAVHNGMKYADKDDRDEFIIVTQKGSNWIIWEEIDDDGDVTYLDDIGIKALA